MTLVDAETGEVMRPDALLPARGDLTPVALVLPSDMTFEEWEDYGSKLRQLDGAVHWWLGDWWLHGERRYGEASAQAAPTGRTSEKLRQAAWVCGNIETVRRRTNLSFTHHAARVAGAAAHEQHAYSLLLPYLDQGMTYEQAVEAYEAA